MGLASKKTCGVCNQNAGKIKFADGRVCKDCIRKAGGFFAYKGALRVSNSVAEVAEAIKMNTRSQQWQPQFKTTKKVGSYLEVDENHQWWMIPDGLFRKGAKIYAFSDIVQYELLEDGNPVAKGGLGRALVGGALFGGVGAIVGGVTGGKKTKTTINSLKIKITLNSINNPTVYLDLITTPTKNSSSVYKKAYSNAQEILSIFSVVKNFEQTPDMTEGQNPNEQSSADEILKFKQLLDSGAITQEEYDAKKKQLLGI